MGLFSCVVAAFGLISCQTAKVGPEKKAEAKIDPQEGHFSSLSRLTQEGESVAPVWEKDRLLFLSFSRKEHLASQIYEFDFKDSRPRRITYNDGVVGRPWMTGGWVFYESTADEEKENPNLEVLGSNQGVAPRGDLALTWNVHEVFDGSLPGTEIYKRRNVRDTQSRLSRKTGRDRLIGVDQTLMLSVHGDETYVTTSDLNGAPVRRLALAKGQKILEFLPSPTGSSALWLDSIDDNYRLWLWNKKNPDLLKGSQEALKSQSLLKGKTRPAHFSWSPDGKSLYFSQMRSDNYDIFRLTLEPTCLEQITFDPADDLHPTVSSDGKNIVFSSHRNSSFQLYQAALKEISNRTCL